MQTGSLGGQADKPAPGADVAPTEPDPDHPLGRHDNKPRGPSSRWQFQDLRRAQPGHNPCVGRGCQRPRRHVANGQLPRELLSRRKPQLLTPPKWHLADLHPSERATKLVEVIVGVPTRAGNRATFLHTKTA